MTPISTLTFNPFRLMMEPEQVLRTMALSQQLRNLRRHKLRPLDKPLIPFSPEVIATRAAFETATDAQYSQGRHSAVRLN
jgi:hypothetical protein